MSLIYFYFYFSFLYAFSLSFSLLITNTCLCLYFNCIPRLNIVKSRKIIFTINKYSCIIVWILFFFFFPRHTLSPFSNYMRTCILFALGLWYGRLYINRGGNKWYNLLTQHEHDMKLVDLTLILTNLGQNGSIS